MNKIRLFCEKKGINIRKTVIFLYIFLVMLPIFVAVNINSLMQAVIATFLLIGFVTFFIFDTKRDLSQRWGIISADETEKNIKNIEFYLANTKNIRVNLSLRAPEAFNILNGFLFEQKSINEIRSISIILPSEDSISAKSISKFTFDASYNGNYSEFYGKIVDFSEKCSKTGIDISIKSNSDYPVETFILTDDISVVFTAIHNNIGDEKTMLFYNSKKEGYKHCKSLFNSLWINSEANK
ncbi:MAG: hypothetical protein E7315_04210 [Clostridiales bacterium]|nr:hypothetical protein [Clostridiales bacterium]